MGRYINEVNGKPIGTSFNAKVNNLKELANAEPITDEKFVEDMVCVINNGFFAAAGYAYDEEEYQEFKRPDGRQKMWLKVPNANKLAQ